MGLSAVVIVALVIFGVALVYWSEKKSNDENSVWAAAAEQLGLSFTPSKGLSTSKHIEGEIRGVEVSVTATNHSDGTPEDIQRYTSYLVSFPAVGPPVRMERHVADRAMTLNGTPWPR